MQHALLCANCGDSITGRRPLILRKRMRRHRRLCTGKHHAGRIPQIPIPRKENVIRMVVKHR